MSMMSTISSQPPHPRSGLPRSLLLWGTVLVAAVILLDVSYVYVTTQPSGCHGGPLTINLAGVEYSTGTSGPYFINFTTVTSSQGLSTKNTAFEIKDNTRAAVLFVDVRLTDTASRVLSVYDPATQSWNNTTPFTASDWLSFDTGLTDLRGSGDNIIAFPIQQSTGCLVEVSGGYSGL